MQSAQKENSLWGFPATALNVSSFVNACREQQTEKQFRLELAMGGIPYDAPTCQMHRQILEKQASQTRLGGMNPPSSSTASSRSSSELSLLDVLDDTPTDQMHRQVHDKGQSSQSGPDNLSQAPAELSLRDDPIFNKEETLLGLATKTALLPHCTLCFLRREHLPSNSPIPEGFDACLCATSIMTAHCLYCALATLSLKMKQATTERTRQDEFGSEFLACQCGSLAMRIADKGELVRKCVGCGGVVTAGFRNWWGCELVFRAKTGEVIAVLPPGGGDGGLVDAGNLIQETSAVNKPVSRLMLPPAPGKVVTVTPGVLEKPGPSPGSKAGHDGHPIVHTKPHYKGAPAPLPPRPTTAPQRPRRPQPNIKDNDSSNTKALLPLRDITNRANASSRRT